MDFINMEKTHIISGTPNGVRPMRVVPPKLVREAHIGEFDGSASKNSSPLFAPPQRQFQTDWLGGKRIAAAAAFCRAGQNSRRPAPRLHVAPQISGARAPTEALLHAFFAERDLDRAGAQFWIEAYQLIVGTRK